jgi:hypothetical protein
MNVSSKWPVKANKDIKTNTLLSMPNIIIEALSLALSLTSSLFVETKTKVIIPG